MRVDADTGIAVKIPKDAIGRPLSEERLKAGLVKLNRDIFFDVGGRLNMEHPNIQFRQGVYWDGRPDGRKHICSMDRGVLGGMVPEVPVWTVKRDIVEADWDEISAQELLAQSPPFPMPCFHDAGKVQIERTVRSELILSGWRHTFDRLLKANIPGIEPRTLVGEFGITLDDFCEACEVPEEGERSVHDDEPDIDDLELMTESGLREVRPTVVLNGRNGSE